MSVVSVNAPEATRHIRRVIVPLRPGPASTAPIAPAVDTGQPVMAIGGFNGTDPAPTLAQFQDLVAKGEIHYFLGGGGRGGASGASAGAIATWVSQHFTASTVDGVTVYDLTRPSGG